MKIKVNDAMSAFASGLQSMKTEIPVEDGGAGSGNWGHAGRPGKRGGSGKGGGSHYREGSKESGYKAKMLTPGEASTKFGSRKGVTAGGGRGAAPSFAPKPKAVHAPSGKAANVSASSSKLNSLLGNGDSKAVAASLREMCKTEPGKILINGKEAFMVGSDGKIHSSEGYDIDPNDAGDMQDVAEGSFIGKVEREASIDKASTASLVDATENGTAGQVLKAMPEGTEIMAGMFYCKKQNGSWFEVGHEGRTKLNDDQMASIVSKAAEGLNIGGGYGYGNSSAGGGHSGGQRIKPSEALEKAGYNASSSPLAVLSNGSSQQPSVPAKKPGRTPAQDKTLKQIIAKTANLKKEQLRIVDDQGKIVLEKRGERGQVGATVGEKREFMPGAIAIHNHPDGGTFSPDDLKDFGFGAKEINVATPDGTYTLTNMKYGTPDQSVGWLDMKDKLESTVPQEVSFSQLQKQAQENMKSTPVYQQMQKISSEWAARKDAGAPKEELDSLYQQYDALSGTYKAQLQAERRRLETEPFNQFYRDNAEKYGFSYTFTPARNKSASPSQTIHFKTREEEQQEKIDRALKMGVPREYAQYAHMWDPGTSKEDMIRLGKEFHAKMQRRESSKQAAKTRKENKLNQALQRMGITHEEYERRRAQQASGVDENGDPIPF